VDEPTRKTFGLVTCEGIFRWNMDKYLSNFTFYIRIVFVIKAQLIRIILTYHCLVGPIYGLNVIQYLFSKA